MNKKTFKYSDYSFNNQNLTSGLPDDICKILVANRTITNLKSGEYLFKEGDTPKGVYRIISGKVKKSTVTTFGTEHIFYICNEKEYLGYHAILSGENYADSAATITDCEIEFINKIDFLKAVDNSHQLTQRLLKNLSHEFRVFINATKALAKYTVRERTALNLLILEHRFKIDGISTTKIIICREDLASMVGTAKESVVRMLKDFKEEKLITTKGRIIFIENYQGLIVASNFK